MSSYSSIQAHRSMAFDTTRNKAYLKAIKKIVNSESIVMDLGAGIGIHGLAAAKAGAKKVFLVEPEPIICIAKQIAEANKLANIETRQTRIEQLSLAEKADVIISVFTGNFLLTEDLLPSLFMARDKFLAPGGKLIPDRAQMFVVPVSAPDYYHRHIDKWSEHTQNKTAPESKEINLSPVRQYTANSIYYDSPEKFNATFLSPPGKLLDLDFMTANKADCHSKIKLIIEKDSICHGWLGWFNIRLGEDWLSTSPEAEKTHWRQALLPLDPPLKLQAGDLIIFELQRPENGEWTWAMEAGKHKQRHSTFFSEPISRVTLQRNSDTHKPLLSQKGQIIQEVLAQLNGNQSTSEIAQQVSTKYRKLYPTRKLADQFVKNLVEKYSL